MTEARPAAPLLGRTPVAWILAGLIGTALACFFVLVSFAFHGALHLATAGLVVAIVVGAAGLPALILGPVLAVPVMLLARAWAWPRPGTDRAIGACLALAALMAGHAFLSRGQAFGRGLLGPLWVDVLCAITCGAIAGGAYWRFAGEPHPPYSAAKRKES